VGLLGSVANKALELLGKHLGMFGQKVEIAGQIVHTWDTLRAMSTEDLQALVDAGRALQAKAKAIEGEGHVLEAEP